MNAPGQRTHQFLISMERSINDARLRRPFVSFKGAQRETGEVLVEGAGTMEITATEGGGLKRMDVKEANPYLRSLAHFPPQAAFRYHRQPSEIAGTGAELGALPRWKRARGSGRECGRHDAGHIGGQVAHRSEIDREESGATFPESRAARRARAFCPRTLRENA